MGLGGLLVERRVDIGNGEASTVGVKRWSADLAVHRLREREARPVQELHSVLADDTPGSSS